MHAAAPALLSSCLFASRAQCRAGCDARAILGLGPRGRWWATTPASCHLQHLQKCHRRPKRQRKLSVTQEKAFFGGVKRENKVAY